MKSDRKSFLWQLLGTGFWRGFWAPIRGARLAFQDPKVLGLVLVPFLINLVLYFLFFYYGNRWISLLFAAKFQAMLTALSHTAPWVPGWVMHILSWGSSVLIWLILGLIAALTFTIVSSIVSAPFSEQLCKATLKHLHGNTQPALSFPKHSIRQTLWLEIKRLLVLGILGILALVLSLIPFFQIPALILGCWVVSFEYFGIPLSLKSSKLLPVAGFILKRPLTSLGFGAFLLLMMALPFTSLFYIPMAVLGGAELYYDG